MSDHLAALRLFVRVARTRSFSASGRELNLPQSTVSRTIATLERELGATLLLRTTRSVTLTEAGGEFLARVEPLLLALDEAEQAARGTRELRGTLRVGLSSSFATRELIPRLSTFMRLHPALRVELLVDDAKQDLVVEGVDLAFRMGALSDSTALARKLAVWSRVVAASPAYLQRAGTPRVPADLAHHELIVGPPRGARAWSFTRGGEESSVRVAARLAVTVNEVATAAAVAGLGIVAMGAAGCRAELERGALVRLLPDWQLAPIELHAVFAAGRAAKPSARALAKFVAELYLAGG
ncbi:MAG TPA: LysR family transcriptional regulator [Polyangiales bacterium]|nr:LysR family transcriptional regulator [Polyangiales bacterium]